MNLFQTTNTSQTLCFCYGTQTLESLSSCRRYTVVKNVRGSHFFCISWISVCDHKVSLIHHSRRVLKKGFTWSHQHRGAPPQYSHKNTAQQSGRRALMFLCFPSQTNVWHLPPCTFEHCTLYFPSKSYLLTFTSNSCLRASKRMMWGRRLSKNRLLIYIVCSKVQTPLALSKYIYIYIFLLSGLLETGCDIVSDNNGNYKKIWMSIWHV